MDNKNQLAHELAMEYVRKTSELSSKSTPDTYVNVYLDAFDEILSILEQLDSDKQPR